MHGQKETALRTVLRHNQMFHREVRIGTVPRDSQKTGRIVPSCPSDHIHKDLHPLVYHRILSATVSAVLPPSPRAVVEFIEGLENKEISLILKSERYLSPQRLELGSYRLIRRSGRSRAFHIKPIIIIRPVVMDVDNTVQSCIPGVTHKFFNSCKPIFFQLILRSLAYMAHPRYRNTHRRKALSFQTVESLLRSLAVTPQSLSGDTPGMRVHLVAKIPTHTELSGHSPREIISRCVLHQKILGLYRFCSSLTDRYFHLFLSADH